MYNDIPKIIRDYCDKGLIVGDISYYKYLYYLLSQSKLFIRSFFITKPNTLEYEEQIKKFEIPLFFVFEFSDSKNFNIGWFEELKKNNDIFDAFHINDYEINEIIYKKDVLSVPIDFSGELKYSLHLKEDGNRSYFDNNNQDLYFIFKNFDYYWINKFYTNKDLFDFNKFKFIKMSDKQINITLENKKIGFKIIKSSFMNNVQKFETNYGMEYLPHGSESESSEPEELDMNVKFNAIDFLTIFNIIKKDETEKSGFNYDYENYDFIYENYSIKVFGGLEHIYPESSYIINKKKGNQVGIFINAIFKITKKFTSEYIKKNNIRYPENYYIKIHFLYNENYKTGKHNFIQIKLIISDLFLQSIRFDLFKNENLRLTITNEKIWKESDIHKKKEESKEE